PKILALTHMAALGWGSMIIFGALYQLLPVILETELYSIRLCWLSFISFSAGLVLLTACFWLFATGIYMEIAGLLLLTGIAALAVNVFLTVRSHRDSAVQQQFIVTACGWLVLTAMMGVMMVFNFKFIFLNTDHLTFLRLHAHMGIGGWFLMLIMGVSSKLVPMFLVSRTQKKQLLDYSYYLVNGSLILFLINGYYNGISYSTYIITATSLAGTACFLVYIYHCFLSRLRRAIDLPMLETLVSFLLLIISILVIPFIMYEHLQRNPSAVSLTMLYGILLFMGWITALILGQTFKTLPFIIWVKHYEHLAGMVKTPSPAELTKKILLRIQFIAFTVFTLTFFSGVFFDLRVLKFSGACSLIVTAVTYFSHVIWLLFHHTKTEPYDNL
ncbi:MAG: hypothetical protein ABWY16_04120, partial [Pedobacter sp.]|uniref:hypothetical protein n=1 Tax=Pedobacter sp. TaxID=1411316 RepID=UPI00339907EC